MTGHRRPGWPALVGVAVALAAAVLGGCRAGPAPSPDGTPPRPDGSASPGASVVAPGAELAHGLLVLTGRVGDTRLELIGPNGATRPLATPNRAVAWVSAGRDGRILATTLDGRAFLSEPVLGGRDPAWDPLAATGFDPERLAGPLAFGTLSPDGRRAAFIAADFAASGPFEVVLVDMASGAGSPTRIGLPPEGAPPAWFGDRLVVLTRERADEVGALVVDPVSGAIVQGPGPIGGPRPPGLSGWIDPIAGLSIAADGMALAVASRLDGRVEVDAAGPWLARATTTPAPVTLDPEADGSTTFAWLALSPLGDRLAIVRTDLDGESVAVTVHDRSAGWREVRRIPLPVGADRAVAAWLP